MSDSVRPHSRQPTRLSRPWDSPGKNTGVGCHFLLQCMKVKSESEVAQSCPTLREQLGLSLNEPNPTPVLLPGKSHEWRSLEGCSPWGREESDTTEQLPFHFSLSCIGEGNGNPLQCSCLDNPRNGGAWWAAVYGVAQIGHDWSDLAAAAAAAAGFHLEKKSLIRSYVYFYSHY